MLLAAQCQGSAVVRADRDGQFWIRVVGNPTSQARPTQPYGSFRPRVSPIIQIFVDSKWLKFGLG